ncbi:hypothetical protein MGYG_02990 [Nannizzia gypsea CBS 118893]|uniref:Uncharacterized protein n=1 Tax=Arthroderma gypseum (strain ATCC MYA-4604 / CBS 118893) TaxID=535722 RepID=E4UQ63_ARTGP|nr:hypothetical protein MGYG_02990 [Nannizzia gypsea CBS 118893]EFQ99982.1 hypothetical protein MGYG_02990 [Nannizzia gypsea CBS 118893]
MTCVEPKLLTRTGTSSEDRYLLQAGLRVSHIPKEAIFWTSPRPIWKDERDAKHSETPGFNTRQWKLLLAIRSSVGKFRVWLEVRCVGILFLGQPSRHA